MFRFFMHPRTAAVAIVALLSMGSLVSAQAPAASTPRLPNGKPDMSGMWRGNFGGGDPFSQFTNKVEGDGDVVRLFPSRRCAPNQPNCRDNTNQGNDYEFTFRIDTNKPLYKPEHWDRVQFLDYDTNFSDPMMKCLPLGIPRIGPPAKIAATADEVMMFYYSPLQTSNSFHYRIVPMNAKHNPEAFPSFYGDSIGFWEGDTLVIESVGFNDETWLSNAGGYFHSFDLKVTERFTRNGNTLNYDVTVEDPSVLLEPWKLRTRQLTLNPTGRLGEGMRCHEIDSEIWQTRIRH